MSCIVQCMVLWLWVKEGREGRREKKAGAEKSRNRTSRRKWECDARLMYDRRFVVPVFHIWCVHDALRLFVCLCVFVFVCFGHRFLLVAI